MMIDRTKSPALQSFVDLKFDYPKYITLSNGVRLYVLNYGDQDVNRLEILYRGGVLEEDKPLQAMVLASMLVHGSDEYSSEQVSEILDYNGSYMNASCQDHYTQITLSSLNQNFENVLPVLKSVLSSPAIPEQEFQLLMSQIKSAYRNARERVKYLSQMAMRGLYYGENHPFAHVVCDEDVDALTIADVKAFHSKYYHPENSIIILSGKVGDKEISLIEKYFGNDSLQGEVAEFVKKERCPSSEKQKVVDKEGALQASVFMAQDAVSRNHPDYIKLRILITALGGYFGSRLMQNIREDKGYTYGISASLLGRMDGAKVVITSECDTAYTYLLIEEVKQEIRKLQGELISNEELEIVKNYMLSDLAKVLDSPFSMASVVSSNILYATGEDYHNRQADELKSITPEELKRVANRYLDADNFYVAIAGDAKQLKLYSK